MFALIRSSSNSLLVRPIKEAGGDYTLTVRAQLVDFLDHSDDD